MKTDPLPADLRRALARAQAQEGALRLSLFDRRGSHSVVLHPGLQTILGRSREADLRLDERGVSAIHALLGSERDGLPWLEDLDSRHGTWVNGRRLEAGQRRELRPGDRINLGAAQGTLRSLAAESSPLLGHEAFMAQLEREVLRARHHRRPLCVAMLEAANRETHVASWGPSVAAKLTPYQLAGYYTSTCLEVLLPEATVEAAEELLPGLCAETAGVTLRRALCSYPAAGTSADALVHQLRRNLSGERDKRGSGPRHIPLRRWLPTELCALIERIAPTRLTALIVGETGSGKERLARVIHDLSDRRDAPFLALSCAAIPEQLVESTLFGHGAGAFTGAAEARAGVFRAAGRGTLFLDNVDALTPRAQGALLEVLETGLFRPVGEHRPQRSEARIIAATHADLQRLVDERRFRQDLRYRLGGDPIEVPPLRGRGELIDALAELFVTQAAEDNRVPPAVIPPEVKAALRGHSWPGNMRELRNVLERATLLAQGDPLGPEHLPAALAPPPPAPRTEPGPAPDCGAGKSFKGQVQAFERTLLLEALEASGGNQSDAARRLSMPRRTLVHKLASLGLRDEAAE